MQQLWIVDPATIAKGGPGSGNFGHAGRPGEVGGSAPAGSMQAIGKDISLSELGLDKNDPISVLDVLPMQRLGGQDVLFSRIVQQQNFDGLPTVVDEAEFERLLRDGEIKQELWRGIATSSSAPKTAAELANDFMDGDYYSGTYTSGSGTYASTERFIAEQYTEVKSSWGRESASGSDGYLLRLGLKKTARVMSKGEWLKAVEQAKEKLSTWNQESEQQINNMLAQCVEYGKADDWDAVREITNKANEYIKRKTHRVGDRASKDLGIIMGLSGFDAVNTIHGEYLIVNRTALFVVRKDYRRK